MTHVEQIGRIPDWIKNLRAPGYRNIFEFEISPSTIYGTEQLCGDWNGELLVLAQDFAPADEVERLVRLGYSADEVYRHNDGDGRYKTGLKTNNRLMSFLFGRNSLSVKPNPYKCGVLYGSACFFLKTGTTSDELEAFKIGRPAFDGSLAVVRYVVEHMPNLKAVMCLGNRSRDMLITCNDFEYRTKGGGLAKRGYSLPFYHAPHPSRGSNSAHEEAWDFLKNDSGLKIRSLIPTDQP